jgi:hypothetical protein
MKKNDYNPMQIRIFSIILFALLAFFTTKIYLPDNIKLGLAIFSLEGILILLSILKPRIFYPVFKTALSFSAVIGSIIFTIISSLVFLVILTPIALIMRGSGKRFLKHKIDKNLDSYYEDYVPHAGINKQF